MEIGLSFILDCFDVRTPWTSGARAPHKVSSLANNWANIFLRVQNFDNFKTNPYLKMLRSMTKSINIRMLHINSKGSMVKLSYWCALCFSMRLTLNSHRLKMANQLPQKHHNYIFLLRLLIIKLLTVNLAPLEMFLWSFSHHLLCNLLNRSAKLV